MPALRPQDLSCAHGIRALLGLALLASLACRAEPKSNSASARANDAGSQLAPSEGVLRLLMVTDLNGVVEPCGCSARSRGGLDRLAAAVANARADGAPTLLLVAGQLFYAPSAAPGTSLPFQEQLEAEAIADALGRMRPAAVLPSRHDLALGAALMERLHASGLPLLLPAASAGAVPAPASQPARWGERSVAIVGAALDQLEPQQAAPVLEQLEEDVRAARATGAQLVIALISAGSRSPALDRALAHVDVALLGAAGAQAPSVHGAAPPFVFHAGQDGESLHITELSWAEGEALTLRTSRGVVLDDAHPRDPAEQTRLRTLARKINQYNLSSAPPVRARVAGLYAGSEPCAACHTGAYLAWRGSAHGHAFRTLQRLDKEYNLDCIGCHVTGFGRGGASLPDLAGVTDVGCEACHGPAAAHVDNPQARTSRPQRAVRTAVCASCHDADHSPDFDLRRYRERLDAPGHRVPAI